VELSTVCQSDRSTCTVSNMPVKIRPMAPQDKPAILQMLRNMPEFKPAEIAVAEEVLDTYQHDPIKSGYYVFIAEIDSHAAGYVCCGPTPLTETTWDIYWLAVAPNQQSQGIGKSLLSFAEGIIKEKHGKMTIIETSSKPEYRTTRRFYRRQGYKPACRIADFYASGDDKLIFIKRLN
jgi:ribosomal protein S18 acetylase RimI-like enzyme